MNMKHQIGQRSVVGMPLSRQPRPQNNNHMLRCLRVVAMTAKKSVVEDGSYQNNAIHFSSWWQRVSNVAGQALLVGILLCAGPAMARLEGVNKPELLPQGGPVTPLIDVAGFLTEGEENRIRMRLSALEEDTGIKVRVLAQTYPDTPGLAIKDYWGVDDNTVVFVADPTTGNILNFNVGQNVDLIVPRSFWSRLAGKFGTKFYWRENGEERSIVNAVAAIDTCLREPVGKLQCSTIRGEDE